jgi:hypothetical protein
MSPSKPLNARFILHRLCPEDYLNHLYHPHPRASHSPINAGIIPLISPPGDAHWPGPLPSPPGVRYLYVSSSSIDGTVILSNLMTLSSTDLQANCSYRLFERMLSSPTRAFRPLSLRQSQQMDSRNISGQLLR